jgi:rSAM/selenodomain-associated transferase 2
MGAIAEAPQLCVIIPTLNEAGALPVLLDQLRRQKNIALEVIVADGGSTDSTGAIAQHAGAWLVAAPRGRGAQMNAGARVATAPRLLFLHADSELTAATQLRAACDALDAEIRRGGARVAGHFALRFARRSLGHGLFYRYVEEKSALNRPGIINGDQGLLVDRAFFGELGSFDESLPFLEDQRIAAKIFERGRWLTLPGPLLTSARRFESEGPHRRYTLMALIMGMHAAGAEDFFARAPNLYAVQAETGRLRVGAYLALARRVIAGRGGLGILYRAGRYSRQNSWQLFYWCDVLLRPLLGRGRYPALRFYDAILRPLTSNVVFDALATLGIGLWFLVVLPLAYAVIDRRG